MQIEKATDLNAIEKIANMGISTRDEVNVFREAVDDIVEKMKKKQEEVGNMNCALGEDRPRREAALISYEQELHRLTRQRLITLGMKKHRD